MTRLSGIAKRKGQTGGRFRRPSLSLEAGADTAVGAAGASSELSTSLPDFSTVGVASVWEGTASVQRGIDAIVAHWNEPHILRGRC